tara:strand:+ start:476348 stop:479197 length:2850 start_codon:yes stop_codon:yes gene_type:complete
MSLGRVQSVGFASLILIASWFVAATSTLAQSVDLEVDSATADRDGIAFFEQHVRPILVDHCYECHSGEERDGGLLLDSRQGGRQGGDTGPAIVAGHPEQSLLIEAIGYANHDLQMPPSGKLPQSQIAKLEKWIRIGAPDPRKATLTPQVAAGISIEEGRKFWSFQPVSHPDVPKVQRTDWVQTPIDAFVLARLEDKGIQPAPAADPRTLIRRITFDLIGMPPTQDEIDAFLLDDSADATKNLVERLLASPQYGVRWGRHWLDVARYADSNGLDENLAFGNAWRYRDYVVQAFNDDKPFDRFLIEQIAGDLVPHATQETKTATGFLVLGAKVLAEPDREKLTMDTIDEQIDVTGKAFMGMTLGCVRCHDHKFDPIKQSDYYSLAAIFRSTKTFGDTNTGAIKHWNETVFATEDEQTRIAEVDAEIAKRRNTATLFKNQALAEIRELARKRAADYLIAATRIDPDMPLTEVSEIAGPLRLHPRILYHCRRHLEFNADVPFFRPWHQFKGNDHGKQVGQHYRPLIKRVAAAVEKLTNAKNQKLDDPKLQSARQAIEDPAGFLAVPAKPEYAFDQPTLNQFNTLMEEARVFESLAPDLTSAMSVSDDAVHEQLAIHIRGSHLSLGAPVPREFPEVMRTATTRPVFPVHQSGRLELARWMASSNHPLTARVYVNRIWRWHFGAGIVGTTENFGLLGDKPTHPQLLDWLARYFMQHGWSTKQLHRLIIASSCYQMSSRHPDESYATESDPENQLHWRFHVNRLSAEQIRDSILATSDQLDRSIGGKTVPLRNRQFVFNHTSVDHTKYDSVRRAIYLPVIRNNLYPLFQQFDFPDPTMPTGHRHSTVVAPQALWMMNSDVVMDAADRVAASLLDVAQSDRSRIESAYHKILGRKPTSVEVDRAAIFISDLTDTGSDSLNRSALGTSLPSTDQPMIRQAWSLLCHGLYASNEFIYVR